MERPPRLTKEEVRRKLELILDQGRVTYTAHCRDVRMPERNVTTQDVLCVLDPDNVSDYAEWSDEHSHWKYKVEGSDLDDDDLTAVFFIIESPLTARVITVF
jgi:hypothetical protein